VILDKGSTFTVSPTSRRAVVLLDDSGAEVGHLCFTGASVAWRLAAVVNACGDLMALAERDYRNDDQLGLL
jgi:hypothetical protein